MELESNLIREWGVLTSSEDFILSGKEAFEEQFAQELPKTECRWNMSEGSLIYGLQNILSFPFSKGSGGVEFPLAIQTLSCLSGQATLTWCYSKTLSHLKNDLEKTEDRTIEVFSNPVLDSDKLKLEKQKAISYGQGKVVDFLIEDPVILETTQPVSIKKDRGLVVFACRTERAFYHLLDLKPGIIYLALHRNMNMEKLIPHVPITTKLGVWGDIPYRHLESVFHPRWDFILPSNLSYPPWVDLFIKSDEL